MSWSDRSPSPWSPGHRPELGFPGQWEAEGAVCWWMELDKIDFSPEATGGRAITGSRAAGDEKTLGEPMVADWNGWLADGVSCPKAGAVVLGHPREGLASLPLQTDRLMGSWSGPRPPPWGNVTHLSSVLLHTSPESFQKFVFLALPSLSDL